MLSEFGNFIVLADTTGSARLISSTSDRGQADDQIHHRSGEQMAPVSWPAFHPTRTGRIAFALDAIEVGLAMWNSASL